MTLYGVEVLGSDGKPQETRHGLHVAQGLDGPVIDLLEACEVTSQRWLAEQVRDDTMRDHPAWKLRIVEFQEDAVNDMNYAFVLDEDSNGHVSDTELIGFEIVSIEENVKGE